MNEINIVNPETTLYSPKIVFDKLFEYLPKDQIAEVMSQDKCELSHDFLGFTDIYDHLSQIIPLHFTVIDFGCYLAAQSYYFRNHALYFGVDTVKLKRFVFPNTMHVEMSISEFISSTIHCFDLKTTFAICSYVPDFPAQQMIREQFNNVFIFYPANKETPKTRWPKKIKG